MTKTHGAGVDVLVGKFFHTTTTCDCPQKVRVAAWQGQIVGAPAEGVLLVELCEWLFGEPAGQELILFSDFMKRNPVLYDTAEDMRFNVEYGQLTHTRECKGCYNASEGNTT